MRTEEPYRTFVEEDMYGNVCVIKESPLDRLPWYWKLALAVGVFLCCIKFTVPLLDWVAFHCF